MSKLLPIPKEYLYFLASPWQRNLMGHETRLNDVKDPAMPRYQVFTASDLEPNLVRGGENGV